MTISERADTKSQALYYVRLLEDTLYPRQINDVLSSPSISKESVSLGRIFLSDFYTRLFALGLYNSPFLEQPTPSEKLGVVFSCHTLIV